MPEVFDPVAVIDSYLQADHLGRVPQFPAFVQALQAISSRDGAGAARILAARAVSPALSYSSVLKLRRWLFPAVEGHNGGGRLRVAILGGSTTTQLVQLVEAFLAAEGIAADLFETEYGVFRQEILTPGSDLDKFQPDLLFIATGSRDISGFPGPESSPEALIELANTEANAWGSLWETANRRWGATVIQNNFEAIPGSVFGHYALRHSAARENYVERLNQRFADSAPKHVVLHDLRGLAAEAGSTRWFDPRFYFEAKMPCSAECLVTYAHSVVSLVRALTGKSRKVLVLDLDNTLWGGQVGDAGAGGVVIGQGSAEGEAYLAFQHHVKQLHDRGVVLAVCSKNDEDKAREPFLSRPDMVLKTSDFSCFVANWQNKADNLSDIATRLDLGLDSFVFFDDNPLERALVRRLAPSVAVPDVPPDPTGYIQALDLNRYFEAVSFTTEDAARARYYSENAQRRELSEQTGDLESFLASLKMTARIEPINEMNIERASQLINKSNQFNLTTRRYTVAELRKMTQSSDWHTLTISLRDQLGDNGLISVILLHRQADTLLIDTWVMSCRVLQRSVEQLALNQIVRAGRETGAQWISGLYIPTTRNQMVQNHYPGLGFEADGNDGATTSWLLVSLESLSPLPTHIEPELIND